MVSTDDLGGSALRGSVSPAQGDRAMFSGGIFGRFPNDWELAVVSKKPCCLVSNGWFKDLISRCSERGCWLYRVFPRSLV